MKVNYHVHTDFSDDSTYDMEQVVKDAIALGIDELCFTDHVDYGVKNDWDETDNVIYRKGGPGDPDLMPMVNVNYPAYYEGIQNMRRLYGDRIKLRLGLEFGVQQHTIPKYEELFRRYPFDFILLSIHSVEDQELWPGDFQRNRTQKEYNERYYEELLAVVRQFHNYSVLAHMDLITRYDKHGAYSFDALKPLLTEILKTVIADGKGIELNTSCHRYGVDDLTPSRDILRLYHTLGGRILTIGSDSHRPEHLGAFVEEDKKELRALGFTEFCTFEKMEPVFHRL